MADPVWVIGDPQGWLDPLRRILHEAELIDSAGRWSGGSATLVVAGDLVDRGPDGIGVIELLMRLSVESARIGGAVQVVIGNHDVLFLAAHQFGGALHAEWLKTGGLEADMDRLTDEHVAWLRSLPAMITVDDILVQHADATFYRDYGSSLEAVNSAFRDVLTGNELGDWRRLLHRFSEHRTFCGPDGCANLDAYLQTFGASRLVHGHSPIAKTLNVPAESVISAHTYCDGRCISVDPGIYLGGPGFICRLR